MEIAPPVEELPLHISVLLYGPPKTGKTAGACSIDGGILLFNCDMPSRTRFARSKKRDPDGRIMEVVIPPYAEDERKQAVPIILPLMGEISRAVLEDQGKTFGTVVVDPVGELYRRLLEEQASRAINLGKNSLQIRLAVTTYIERFCRFLTESPVNAVFVCHELVAQDEETESFERLPFTGTSNTNLGQKIMGMVDIVGYTGVARDDDESKRYMAQLVPGLGQRGGDGFDCLGDSAELNLAAWVETIKAHEAEGEPESAPEPAPKASRKRIAAADEKAA